MLEKDGISAMPKSQSGGYIEAPGPNDKDLKDFAAGLQETFDELYTAAHDHRLITADPGPRDGSVEAISIVDNGTSVYLVVKTKRGWFKSASFTAL